MNPNSSVSMGQQLRKWWDSLNDDDKQAALDTFGELAGGTVGALSGSGVASIPAAGAGAVVGKGAARGLGRAIGLKPTPQSNAEITKDIAGTFATNAAGEGIGRAIQPAYRGVKALAKRAAQLAVKPNQQTISRAAAAGVELTPGMVSDRPLVHFVESALEKTPGGTNTIRGKTVEAVGQWEDSARQIPKQFHPNPVSDAEAGTAAQTQLGSNRSAATQHYKQQYTTRVNQLAGDAPIDFSIARDEARQFLEEFPQGMEAFFPQSQFKKLQQIAGMTDMQRVPGGAIDTGYPAMTFAEAQKLRTSLLEAERAMTHGDASIKRRAIPILRDAIDRSIDDSLGNSTNPNHQRALQEWRSINSDFRDTARELYPHGKGGNPTTATIEQAKRPESLPSNIASSPTAIQDTKFATAPKFGAPDEQVIPKFQRNRADALLDDSRTQNRFVGDQRFINPRRLEKTLDDNADAAKSLYGPGPYQELRNSAELGKAITRPSNFTNTSETARFSDLLRYGGAVGGAVTGAVTGDGDALERSGKAVAGAAIGGYAIPRAAAGAWTSGAVRRALTTPPPALTSPMGGPLLGAAGRSIMRMATMPESKGSSDLPADFLADSPAGDLPADFIDQDATARLKRTPPALSAPR